MCQYCILKIGLHDWEKFMFFDKIKVSEKWYLLAPLATKYFILLKFLLYNNFQGHYCLRLNKATNKTQKLRHWESVRSYRRLENHNHPQLKKTHPSRWILLHSANKWKLFRQNKIVFCVNGFIVFVPSIWLPWLWYVDQARIYIALKSCYNYPSPQCIGGRFGGNM